MKITQKLLTPNEFSRPSIGMKKIKGIIVHGTANPNTTALQNISFFEKRKYGKDGYGSAHYFIDLNGDVFQCIPDDEMAYHVGAKKYKEGIQDKLSVYPNNCTIGIECCVIDNDVIKAETYDSLVLFIEELLQKYNLTIDNLYRHFDISDDEKGDINQSPCPRWFVINEDEWQIFKTKVAL